MRTRYGAAWAAGGLLALVGWLAFASTPASADTVLDLASVLVPAIAAVFAGLAARSTQGRVRSGWVVMAAGLVCAAVAEGIWAYRDLAGATLTSPSVADAAYLTFLVSVLAALLLFPAGGNHVQSRARLVLDGIVMASSLFVVAWLTVIRNISVEDTPVLLVSLAYPVFNLVVLTVAAVSLARSGSSRRLVLTLLTCGLIAMTLAESVFAYVAVSGPFSGHHVVELVWLTGMVLILVATVEGGRATFEQRLTEPLGWTSVWLPYAPFMLAVVVMAPQPRVAVLEAPIVVAGVILLPAILLRQFLAVAETRRLVATVTEQALHDPLTGLSNRALFNERLERAMSKAGHEGTSVGVVLLDLDDFKLVNDSLGHASGDELLVAAADRLRETAGADDMVARLGGDEFAVVVSGSPRVIRDTAERLDSAFGSPFLVEGHELRLRPTVGLAIAETPGLSAAALLKQADTAMYAGKRSKTVGVHMFSAAMADGAGGPEDGGSGSLRTLTELHAAVDNGDLDLVYRPQADLRTGEVVGVEALLRWPHPDRGLLLPRHFLPLIRRHGLIDPVTDLVLGRALEDAVGWQRNGIHLMVSLNLFAPSLEDDTLPARVEAMLSQRGLHPDMLTVEITEDLPIDRDGRAGRVLAALREMGIRIAIDDFGSGYSRLSDLCRLPIDEIKFDEEFVGAVLSDPKVAAVVRSVTALAGEFGLTTVGEGVRNSETARRLLDLGCDIGQGDHFGPPLRAAEVPGFLGRPPAAGRMPAPDLPRTVAP